MAKDLLIRGARLVDPAQGFDGPCDISVRDGRIAELGWGPASLPNTPVLDARGLIATPGLIDLHTHVAHDIVTLALPPDEAGVLAGMTTVCDAGSTGFATFRGFRRLVIPHARTDVLCFLHLFPVGEALLPEIGEDAIDEGRTLDVIQSNRDVIRGVKVRAIGRVMNGAGIRLFETARRIASRAGLPLMVHLGIEASESVPVEQARRFTHGLLDLLQRGDILTHAFTPKVGGVISVDGTPAPGLEQALQRGVLLDVAAGGSHLSFQVARAAIDQGILPNSLSTDITIASRERPEFFSLTAIMSRFLALGLSLGQVVAMATIHPARALGETERGILAAGAPADVTLLEPVEGSFAFVDGRASNVIPGQLILRPRTTVKGGEVIPCRDCTWAGDDALIAAARAGAKPGGGRL